MKLKALAEAVMWLPGFAPDEDPIEVLGVAGERREAEVIPFPERGATTAFKSGWPRLDESVFAGLAGDVTKFEANLSAIELLRRLEAEHRHPTADERAILNRYTGWGGLPQAFNLDQRDRSWGARAERLKELLSEAEHESAEASTPNAHYTSLEVIEAMWAMVQRLGFKGGRILEPAAGVGYFLGAMPEEVARNSRVTAIELDDLSARILEALYGAFGGEVLQDGFERTRLPAEYFDLAIGNVPFGNLRIPIVRDRSVQFDVITSSDSY